MQSPLLKITEFFLENPYEEIHLRELARKLNLSPFAVKKYADALVKEGLVTESKRANLRYLKSNVSNLFFKHLKISLNVRNILNSKLVEFLKENVPNISSVVLFGSMAKGENTAESDVDILIIGKNKHLNLEKFEKKLNRDINYHIFSWSSWKTKAEKDKPFYYEVIIHGIPLFGELPAK